MEDEDGIEEEEEEEEEEGNVEDVDDAVFGVDEVGCLDYILKRYPYNPNGILPPFCHPHAFTYPVDSVYANFPENSGSSNLPTNEYPPSASEKCFVSNATKKSHCVDVHSVRNAFQNTLI